MQAQQLLFIGILLEASRPPMVIKTRKTKGRDKAPKVMFVLNIVEFRTAAVIHGQQYALTEIITDNKYKRFWAPI